MFFVLGCASDRSAAGSAAERPKFPVGNFVEQDP